MANANRPSGLTPVKSSIGGGCVGQGNIYSIAAGYASDMAIGDPVISSGSADVNGVPGVVLAGATGAIRGVIVGLGTSEGLIANPDNLYTTIRPASAPVTWYALVIDDPEVIFEVQEIGTGTALTAAEVGLNTNLVSGTHNNYISGWQLDNAAEATTATLQVRLLGLARRADNTFGAYAKWLVKINNHELSAGTAGV